MIKMLFNCRHEKRVYINALSNRNANEKKQANEATLKKKLEEEVRQAEEKKEGMHLPF